MKTRLAITDDHPMILEGIKNLISFIDNVELVASYNSSEETLKKIESNLPDLLLLDVNLPKIDGFDLCKSLKAKMKTLKIIALSSYDDVSVVKRMLSNGADGYLLKNTSKEELKEAIVSVLNGECYLQRVIEKKILMSSLGKSEKKNDFVVKLTRREKEVLGCIYAELTIQETADKLYVSPKTIETHRMNLMSKLGARNSIGIIKAALESGLLNS